MDCCMGAKPPVTKPEMLTQSAWRTARAGSKPCSRSSPVSNTVATKITMAVTFAMNWVVWITFGTTCSLRASDV